MCSSDLLEVRAERGGKPRAWADELMLNRAVGNLLSNALRHGHPDCTVTVKALARGDGSAEIEVANPGSGIAAEHLPRIFDRFYRPCSSAIDLTIARPRPEPAEDSSRQLQGR